MKKLMLVVTAMLALAMPVKAEDSVLNRVWGDLQTNSSFHVFDNGTPAYFYDFKQHEQMAGLTTEFYQYRYSTLDLGLLKSIDGGTNHVLPVLNANVHAGTYLAKIPAVQAGLTLLGLNSGVLQYFTLGGWAGRDFATSNYRYGLSSGFRIEFK